MTQHDAGAPELAAVACKHNAGFRAVVSQLQIGS